MFAFIISANKRSFALIWTCQGALGTLAQSRCQAKVSLPTANVGCSVDARRVKNFMILTT